MRNYMTIKPLSYLNNLRFHRAITSTIVVVLTIISLATKQLFYNNNHFDVSWIVPSFNEGISYSISVNIVLVIFVSVICLLWLIRMYDKWRIHSLILIMIMSGGMSNLIDRVFYGWVRDYLYLWHSLPFLNFVFNLADVMLVIGGVLLIYHYHQVDILHQDPDSDDNLV